MYEPRAELNKIARELLSKLDSHVQGECIHGERVAVYAVAMGEKLDLPIEDLTNVRFAAQLHDIGKLHLPADVLTSSELSPEQTHEIRKHAEFGIKILGYDFDPLILSAVVHHHERWDGAGYPDNLAGEEIPLWSRLIAAAEVFDVLSHQVYWREPLPEPAALEEIKSEAGKQLDPEAVDLLIQVQPLIQPLSR